MIIYSLESRSKSNVVFLNKTSSILDPNDVKFETRCKSFKKLIEGWTFLLDSLWFGGVMTRDLKPFRVSNKHNELGSTAFDYPTYLLSKVFLSFLFLALYDQITPFTPEKWVLQLDTLRSKSFRFSISEIQKIWQKNVTKRFTYEAAESSV